MRLVAHAPAHDPVQRAEHGVQKSKYRGGSPQPSVRQVRHRRLRQAGNVPDLLERHGRKMQHAGATDLFETVNFRNISAWRRRDAAFRFGNHVLAIAEANRARGTYRRAGRLEISLQAIGAEGALVDLRCEVLVIVFRNNEWAGLHARPAADAAALVEHYRTEIRLEHRCCRTCRSTRRVLAMHAELATKYPIGLRARNDLVERNERIIVGVETARVLIALAGEENVFIRGSVIP